ncbi:MAG: hypothetical protein ACUVTY_08385 [Armatimonadota bacterium]
MRGQRGFSELEGSQTDQKPGERIWCLKNGEPSSEPQPGKRFKRGSVEL